MSRFGIVLQQPAYSRYYLEVGEISSYPPGYKENAGIFCHNNPWIMIAESLLGRGDKAYDYFKRLAPAFFDDNQQLRRTEPYVYAQMVAGPDAPRSGEAKNSWLTGTAAWNYTAITQFLLGIRPLHVGLRISPTVTPQVGTFRVRRRCRGAEYAILVQPTQSEETAGIFVDGKKQSSEVIPYASPGTTVDVECRFFS